MKKQTIFLFFSQFDKDLRFFFRSLRHYLSSPYPNLKAILYIHVLLAITWSKWKSLKISIFNPVPETTKLISGIVALLLKTTELGSILLDQKPTTALTIILTQWEKSLLSAGICPLWAYSGVVQTKACNIFKKKCILQDIFAIRLPWIHTYVYTKCKHFLTPLQHILEFHLQSF